MSFSWFLALRYLKPKRTAFSVITLLSILGVMLAVAVLIVVIGVMSGFDQQIRAGFLKMEPHIFLTPKPQFWDAIEEKMAAPADSRAPEGRALSAEKGASRAAATPSETVAPPANGDAAPLSPPPDPAGPAEAAQPAAPAQATAAREEEPSTAGETGDSESPPKASRSVEGYGRWRSLIAEVKRHPEVQSVHPYIFMTSLLEAEAAVAPEPMVATFYSIDLENKDQVEKLKAMMVPPEKGGGQFDLEGDASSESDKILLNLILANKLGVSVGDKVNAFSPENMKEIRKAWKKREAAKDDEALRKTLDEEMDKLLVPSEFVVSGLFRSDQHSEFAVISLESGQELSGRQSEDWITGLAVVTNNSFRAEETAFELFRGDYVYFGWGGDTWIGKHRDIFNAVQNERSMLYIVLMIITVVAAFSTSISMIIFAVQKRREIGMIRSLGAKTSQVLMIFTSQGMIVGLLGVALGAGSGFLILHYRNPIREFLAARFGINIFPADIYQLPEIPAHLTGSDLLWICIPAFLLCSVAALLPALVTCRQDPARSLRGER